MKAEFFEEGVGVWEGGEVLCGEERREAILPEVMGALDLAFGLWSGGVARGDFVEAQGRAELGERVGCAGEEERVVVDGERERQAVGAEGRGQEVEMSVKIFAFVVGTRRDGREELAQRGQHRFWRRSAVVAAQGGRTPGGGTALGAGGEIGGVEFVEAGAPQAEFSERLVLRKLNLYPL